MNLKKIGKVFTSKFVGTGPSSYKTRNLPGCGLTKVEKDCPIGRSIRILLHRENKKFPHELSIVRFSKLTVLYTMNPDTFSFRNTRHSKILQTIVLSDYWRVVVTRKIDLFLNNHPDALII